jgi:fatty acid desaturase
LANASSLVINFRYQNDKLPDRHTAEDTFWELMTWFRAAVMIGLVLMGVMPWIRLPKILLLAMAVLTINHLRTLVAHRYSNDGNSISHLEQFMDSTNITGGWWTELWCPLGLRYHALHHLFPGIPYHNLGVAHRRLMNLHDEHSIYHQSVYANFQSVIKELFQEIQRNESVPLAQAPSISKQD